MIRKVSFTGSTAVGKHLMKLAADRVQRITMELGGHAPVLIFDDCDLETTLDRVVMQKFRNAGQVCGRRRAFMCRRGYDAFVADRRAHEEGENRQWADADTQMGPLANARRIRRWRRLLPTPRRRARA